MKIRADSIIRVPAGTRMGLTDEQFRARVRRVEVPEELAEHMLTGDLPPQEMTIVPCIAKDTLEFKAGEVLHVFGIDEGAIRKFISGDVTVLNEAAEIPPDGDGPHEPGKDEATDAAPPAAPAPAPKPGKAKKAEKSSDNGAVSGV